MAHPRALYGLAVKGRLGRVVWGLSLRSEGGEI